MIVLHAGRVGNKFFIWGESPVVNEIKEVRRGRKPKKPAVKPYPYDASFDNLFSALELIVGSIDRKETEKINLWLPTINEIPVPSSPLIAENPDSEAGFTITPWTVLAYHLEVENAISLLCNCMGKRVLAPGIITGNDLLWWAETLKFAGSLVAGQKYLPGVRVEEEEYRAFWEPVFTGEDAEKLSRLSKQMPPVARALSSENSVVPPDMPAASMVRQFIEDSVDWIVRSEVREKDLPKDKRKKQSFDSVHDAWVSALGSPDGLIYGEEKELQQLIVMSREWQRPLTILTTSPFRLCFRLEEPIEEKENAESKKNEDKVGKEKIAGIETPVGMWYVRYLLQPYEDPSLLIPVSEAWKPKKGSPLKRYDIKNIRQFLLSSLGQAAGISPGIASSLETPNPSGYSLDTREAYRFLTESAANLSQAGFGLLLPGWWTRKGTRTHLNAQAKVKSKQLQAGNGLTLDKIVSFDWEIALGDRTLTVKELQALAKLKAPLVKFRGQWVEVNDEEIRSALEFWKKNPHGEASLLDVIKLAVGASENSGGLDFKGVDADGWIEELIGHLKDKVGFEELPAPFGFLGTLRPYQFRGYSWLAFLRQWGIGACLADDMGLGKTIQTLALIQHDLEQVDGVEQVERVEQVEGVEQSEEIEQIEQLIEQQANESRNLKPVLLVCPTSVINNWRKEAARFTPELSVMVHHGTSRKKEEEFKKEAMNNNIIVSSYGLLQRDVKFLKGISWAGVILDEAQNIKNPETKQAKAARALEADYRIALTGTPVENNVGDLWSIMEFLNPGFLGSQAGFKRNFFIPIQAERDQEAARRLKEITGPFILRRLKTDSSIISDLPDKMEMKTYCTLTKEQASLYAAVLEDIEEAIEESEESEESGIRRKGIILSALTRLKQVCNHPAQLLKDNSSIPGRSGKLAMLTEMLDVVLANKEKALVFTQFAEMGKMIKEHLQASFGCEVLFLHGGVSRKQRDRMIERFQEGKEYLPIFVLSLKAGGTGLNLTGANHVFHFDRWWNPAVENQATDRAFRIGQTKNVEVHKFICAGTLEERIDEIIERKVQVAGNVVGTGENWLTELSNEELKDIFALREEAVGE